MKSIKHLRIKTALVPLAALVLMGTGSPAFAEGIADLAGNWSVTTVTPRGDQTETLMIGEDGSGKFGSQEVTVTLDGDTVSFDANRETPRGNIPLSLTGTVDGDSIEGTYTMDTSAMGAGGMGGAMGGGGMAPPGELTWSATRSTE